MCWIFDDLHAQNKKLHNEGCISYVVVTVIGYRVVTFYVDRVDGGTRGCFYFDDMIATERHMFSS